MDMGDWDGCPASISGFGAGGADSLAAGIAPGGVDVVAALDGPDVLTVAAASTPASFAAELAGLDAEPESGACDGASASMPWICPVATRLAALVAAGIQPAASGSCSDAGVCGATSSEHPATTIHNIAGHALTPGADTRNRGSSEENGSFDIWILSSPSKPAQGILLVRAISGDALDRGKGHGRPQT